MQRFSVVSWFLALLAFPLTADATIVVRLDVDALTTAADVVALGRVDSLQSRWEGQRIVTDYDVRVIVPIAGQIESGARLTVRSLGGRVDDLAQVVHGVSPFVVGEDVVVFLQKTKSAGLHRVVGMAQGRFELLDKGADGAWVQQDLTGLALARVTGSGDRESAQILGHAAPMRMELRQLLRQIDQALIKVGHRVRPEVRTRFGDRFDKPYDFSLEAVGTDR